MRSIRVELLKVGQHSIEGLHRKLTVWAVCERQARLVLLCSLERPLCVSMILARTFWTMARRDP